MSERRRIGWGAALGAAAVALVTGVAGPRRWAGYSAREQYLSELGTRQAPDGAAVSAGFVATGVLLLVALADLVTARRRREWPRAARLGLVGVLGGFGVSYAVAGVARCDPGCPESGDLSVSQQVHNAAGTVGYAAALVGMAAFGWSLRHDPRHRPGARASLAAAPGLAAVAALTPGSDARGLLQRIVEVGVFAWIVAVAVAGTGGDVRRSGGGRSAGEG